MKNSAPNTAVVIKLWRMRWEGYVAQMGDMRNANKIFARKPDGKSPLVRPR
jgi:hypothetical protein